MQFKLGFAGEHVEIDLADDRVVAAWNAPQGVLGDALEAMAVQALGAPDEYPRFEQAVVPGDKVVIALDPNEPVAERVARLLVDSLLKAGVEPGDLTLVAPVSRRSEPDPELRVSRATHEPGDTSSIAYLASTREGRRIYLNRLLVDADAVAPVGVIGQAATGRWCGPWSTTFPGLSNAETRSAYARPWESSGPSSLERDTGEALEVSWLLGSRFHVAIVPGGQGALEIIAGRDDRVRDRAIAAYERHWSFKAPERAELVIAGLGAAESGNWLDPLACALRSCLNLVQRGGRIVVLSRAEPAIGPALGRLLEVNEPRAARETLRGAENESDYAAALLIAQTSEWADVFLHSALDPATAESLGMTPLERPGQAARLAAQAYSVILVNHAEKTLAHAP